MITPSWRRQIQLLVVAFTLLPLSLHAYSIEDLKEGVVRVMAQHEGKTRTGTGFVLRHRGRTVNIVTAAHVVEGASQVDVEFFTKTGQFFRGKILGLEGGESSGLAALVVEGDLPSTIRVLALNHDMAVRAGDAVTIIGFPQKAGVPWAVTTSEVIGRRGKAIVFSGAVDGNRGHIL